MLGDQVVGHARDLARWIIGKGPTELMKRDDVTVQMSLFDFVLIWEGQVRTPPTMFLLHNLSAES